MQEEGRTSLITTPSSDLGPASASAAGRSRLYAVMAVAALLTVVLDQGSKVWALRTLEPGVAKPLIGHWIQLNLIRNSGAAFSLGDKVTWLLTVLSVLIIIAVVFHARRVSSRVWAITFGLLLGGAVGNLIDRVWRAPGRFQGHVVDFIDYFGLFIGNVADIAIVGAAGLVIWLTFRGPHHHSDDATAGHTHSQIEGTDG